MQVIEKTCYWFVCFLLHTEKERDSKKKHDKKCTSVLKYSPECVSVLQSLVTWLSLPEIWCLGVRVSQAQQLSLAWLNYFPLSEQNLNLPSNFYGYQYSGWLLHREPKWLIHRVCLQDSFDPAMDRLWMETSIRAVLLA